MPDFNRVRKRTLGELATFQTRENTETGERYIAGYFSVFNSDYELWPGATESIAETAFDGALSDDIRCLIDHDTRLVLGRTKAGTLSLKTDSRGLWGEVKVNPMDQDAMNLYERVKRGDVDQCSFGFDILEETFEERGAEVNWTIKKVKLYEVSVVTFPAYEETEVSARKQELNSIQKRAVQAWQHETLQKLKGEAHGTENIIAPE